MPATKHGPGAEVSRANGLKGGRPVGAASRLSRKRADEIAMSGEGPLDIMLDNMVFWHRAAQSYGERLEEVVRQVSSDAERADALKLLHAFLNAREQSQRCAVDAAPYVHPKLASLTLKGNVNAEVKHILGNMTPQEAAEAYATMLKKPNGKPDKDDDRAGNP